MLSRLVVPGLFSASVTSDTLSLALTPLALRSTDVSPASSLLWPLLTAQALSGPSPPRVRCCIFPNAPSGST